MEKDEQNESELSAELINKKIMPDALERKISRAIETHNRVDKQALYKLLYPERQDIIDDLLTSSK